MTDTPAPGELKYSISYVARFVLHTLQNSFTRRRVYDWHTNHIVPNNYTIDISEP